MLAKKQHIVVLQGKNYSVTCLYSSAESYEYFPGRSAFCARLRSEKNVYSSCKQWCNQDQFCKTKTNTQERQPWL